MSAYIKLSTLEYPRHEADIRAEHAEITQDQTGDTFPCPPTYAKVQWVNPPVIDTATQTYYEVAPVLSEGVWQMSWEIRTLTVEEQQARAAMLANTKPE